jgi:hypothetical protein
VNRYIVSGLLADMRAGRRVVFISKDWACMREAFTAVAFWLETDERAIRASGWERCESADGKGSIRFFPLGGSYTGMHTDVVVADAELEPRQKAEVLQLVDMHGEVICL